MNNGQILDLLHTGAADEAVVGPLVVRLLNSTCIKSISMDCASQVCRQKGRLVTCIAPGLDRERIVQGSPLAEAIRFMSVKASSRYLVLSVISIARQAAKTIGSFHQVIRLGTLLFDTIS